MKDIGRQANPKARLQPQEVRVQPQGARLQSHEAHLQPQVIARYLVHVKVADMQLVGNARCFLVHFTPDRGAPAGSQEPCHLFVRERDGWPEKIVRGNTDLTALWLEHLGEASVLGDAPEGFPIEIWPCDRSLTIKSTQSLLAFDLRQQEMGTNRLFFQSTLKSGEREQLRIHQTWHQGSKWWTDYERYIKGHKDLRARHVPDNTPNSPSAMPAAAQPVETGLPLAVWLTRHPPGSDVDDEGLHDDPRLRVPLTGMMKSPTIPDLLARLQEITHLIMTSEPATPSSAPVFGNPHFHGTPAYVVMQQMAKSEDGKGRWQATADGYCLLLDRHGREPEVPPPTIQQPKPSFPFGAVAISATIVVVLFLVMWRLRSVRANQRNTNNDS